MSAITVGPEKKVPVPENIRHGMRTSDLLGGNVTRGYNDFQLELARAELARIIARYGLEEIGNRIVDEGWLDGSRVLQVDVLTRTKRHVRIEWVDANQAFFKRFLDCGGAAMLFEHDLA